jgi:hypothetical protein
VSAAAVFNRCARIVPVDSEGELSFLVDAPVPRSGLRRTFVSPTSAPGAHRFLLRASAGAESASIVVQEDEVDDVYATGLLVAPEDTPEPISFAVPLTPPPRERAPADPGPLAVNPDMCVQSAAQAPPPAEEEWASCRFVRDGTVAWAADPVRELPFCHWLEPAEAETVRGLLDGTVSPRRLDERRRDTLAEAGLLVAPLARRTARRRWVQALHSAAATLARDGYAVVPGLLPRYFAAALQRYYDDAIAQGFLFPESSYLFGHHNEAVAVWLHHHLAPIVARIVPEPVKPSYAFVAVYGEGAELVRHTARAQCEYTLSVAGSDVEWALHLETRGGPVEARLALGDAVLFKGRELPHFRAPLAGAATYTSLLFHYVPADFDGSLD